MRRPPNGSIRRAIRALETRTATFHPSDDAPRVEAPAPQSLGRYQIKDFLGRGAFGVVYLGWDPELQRQVAIKVPRLRADAAEDEAEGQIEAFLAEARRAVQLERRAGIVPVYDVGREDDVCYIVSQYIEGGTLSQLIAEGPPPIETTVRLISTLAGIVHFAHCQGWIHRDIKPSNILLDAQGNPYLADFGLTSRLDEIHSSDGPPTGTPNYMAPEAAREALHQMRRLAGPAAQIPDQRSDVYSLGVVLYQMLTGRLPFEADDLETLFDLVLHGNALRPREFNPAVPARLEETCLAALAKDPADRHQTAAELRDELEVVAASLESVKTQIRLNDRAWLGLAPARLAAVVGTALLLGALAAAVYFASAGWRKPIEHTQENGETHVAQIDSGARDEAKLVKESRVLQSDKKAADGLEPPPAAPLEKEVRAQMSFPRLFSPSNGNENLNEELEETRQKLLAESLRLTDARGAAEARPEALSLFQLGRVQSRSGNDDQAADSFARAEELLPATASYEMKSRLLCNRISSLLVLRRHEAAKEQAVRLREIARPDDPLAQRILKLAEMLAEETAPDEK